VGSALAAGAFGLAAARLGEQSIFFITAALAPPAIACLFVVKPGDTNKSELVRRIFATDDDQMPPEKSHRVLSAADKDLLKRWVEQGAEYKPFWSFIPVEKVTPPKHTSSWARNRGNRTASAHVQMLMMASVWSATQLGKAIFLPSVASTVQPVLEVGACNSLISAQRMTSYPSAVARTIASG